MKLSLCNIKKQKEGKSRICPLPSNWEKNNVLSSITHLMHFLLIYISFVWSSFSFYSPVSIFFCHCTDSTSKPPPKFSHFANVHVDYKSMVVSRSAQTNLKHHETPVLLMVVQELRLYEKVALVECRSQQTRRQDLIPSPGPDTDFSIWWALYLPK